MKRKKRFPKFLVTVLILALIAGGLYYYRSIHTSSMNYSEETARTQTIETYYTFTGNLEPGSVHTIYANSEGSVREWLVEEGEAVKQSTEVMRTKSNGTYTARKEGIITKLYIKENDSYVEGEPLFRIADYAHPLLNIKVDEYDVSALQKNMPVSIKVLATGEIVNGKLTHIDQEAVIVNDMAFYMAEIAVDKEDLKMGLSCEISVLHERAENATTISVKAIQYDSQMHPFVYVYDRNDEITQQRVTLGVSNGTIVEIKDGLRSGETVLIPASGMDEIFERMMQMRRSRTR